MSNYSLGKNDSLTGSGRMGQRLSQKEAGAYYTPDVVVATLLRWAVRSPRDRLIDPSCGDGRFIAGHRNSVGIEQDVRAAGGLWPARRGPSFTTEIFLPGHRKPPRFDCAAGNPPFIRCQRFNGDSRARAIELCARLGADFTGLASSWAPFLVATAGLLRGEVDGLPSLCRPRSAMPHMLRHCWIILSIISRSSTLWRSGKNFSRSVGRLLAALCGRFRRPNRSY